MLRSAAITSIVFGLITLFLTVSIFFDLFGIREKEGNYVLSVIWVNFICAILYLAGGIGLFLRRRWSTGAFILAILALIIGIVLFRVHINAGGLYETKTQSALIFRLALTTIFAIASYSLVRKK